MKRYTVVLQTPDYVAEQYGEEHPIIFVEGESPKQAVAIAQGIATINAKDEPEDEIDPVDFRPIAVFEGWHTASHPDSMRED
jgi:hypothetical protein